MAVVYYRGSDLADLGLLWLDSDKEPINFGTGYTYVLKVGPKHKPSVTSFTKTTGFTGAAGSKGPPIVPNVTIAWANTGELNSLEPGIYTGLLTATRTADSKDREMSFEFEIKAPFITAPDDPVDPPADAVVCTLWAQPSDLGPGAWSAAEASNALAIASDALYALSGRQFPGLCTDTVRPVRNRAGWDAPPVVIPGFGIGQGVPFAYAGWGLGLQERWAGCGCESYGDRRVRLGAEPIVSITEVRIDGVVIDPSAYTVEDGRWLVTVADPTTGVAWSWPCCQLLDRPATEVGTWQVVFVFGARPPVGGKASAIALGNQILKAGVGEECQLPPNVTQLIRQGLTVSMADPETLFDKGMTGIRSVDRWVNSVNPRRLKEPGRVLSPDLPRSSVHLGP